MAEPTFRLVPLVRIFDLAKALESVYLQVSRGDLVLHLTEHHGDCCPGATVLVHTTHLDDLHREITSRGYRYMRPGVETMPWNARVMEVIDPFGNRLRFSESTATTA